MPPTKKTGASLRERKKARTIAAVQQHALRLFRENGYQQTTVEQIAEAADISQSTFFRYFRTKEDVLMVDNYDPIMIEEFVNQPADISPITAICNAMLNWILEMTEEEMQTTRERIEVIMSIPELRASTVNNMISNMDMIAEQVAIRLGIAQDDFYVRVLAGAVTGTCTAVLLHYAEHPDTDFATLLRDGFNQLEAGLSWKPSE